MYYKGNLIWWGSLRQDLLKGRVILKIFHELDSIGVQTFRMNASFK